MTKQEAKKVKVGQRVVFLNDVPGASEDHGSKGTVKEVLYCGFEVAWDDGSEIDYKFDHARHIHRA
jgi:hypothetical protein